MGCFQWFQLAQTASTKRVVKENQVKGPSKDGRQMIKEFKHPTFLTFLCFFLNFALSYWCVINIRCVTRARWQLKNFEKRWKWPFDVRSPANTSKEHEGRAAGDKIKKCILFKKTENGNGTKFQ